MTDSESTAPSTGQAGRPSSGRRALEPGIQRDFSQSMSYGGYLRLDLLLAAQQPLSDPAQHDELLFIIQHQTSELWLKLLVHELRSARDLVAADDLSPALKRMARVKHIQRVLTDQWSVLATLTPSEYAQIRPFLASSSGFQSAQYREVEFLLGNKDADMVKVFNHDPDAQTALSTLLAEPSLYDEFLRYLHRHGYAVPAEMVERDWSVPHSLSPEVVDVFADVYSDPAQHWIVYETCEELVDMEDNFQQWRFRHLQVVQRTIGGRVGTGGSSGVSFLRRALDITFFPELFEVRSRIGS
jgi:tryptophan 2,3-dioxygenase